MNQNIDTNVDVIMTHTHFANINNTNQHDSDYLSLSGLCRSVSLILSLSLPLSVTLLPLALTITLKISLTHAHTLTHLIAFCIHGPRSPHPVNKRNSRKTQKLPNALPALELRHMAHSAAVQCSIDLSDARSERDLCRVCACTTFAGGSRLWCGPDVVAQPRSLVPISLAFPWQVVSLGLRECR